MNRAVVVVFALAITVGRAAAQSSVTGQTFNAPLGQVFYGQIATFTICSGQTITAIYADLNWGDGTVQTGAEIPDPLYQAKLLGSHSYGRVGKFTIGISLVATCYRDFGSGHEGWRDAASGTATAIVPPEIAISSIILNPSSVARGGTVAGTITIASPAPSWGTLVQLGSADATTATVPPGIVVQATDTTATFAVSTKAFSGTSRKVNVTAVSGGSARSAALTVK